jgi:hypothetical protein
MRSFSRILLYVALGLLVLLLAILNSGSERGGGH